MDGEQRKGGSRPQGGKRKLAKLKPLPPYVKAKVHPSPAEDVEQVSADSRSGETATVAAETPQAAVLQCSAAAASHDDMDEIDLAARKRRANQRRTIGLAAIAETDSAGRGQISIDTTSHEEEYSDLASQESQGNVQSHGDAQANGDAHNPAEPVAEPQIVKFSAYAGKHPHSNSQRIPTMLSKSIRGASATQLQDRCRLILEDVAGPNPAGGSTAEIPAPVEASGEELTFAGLAPGLSRHRRLEGHDPPRRDPLQVARRRDRAVQRRGCSGWPCAHRVPLRGGPRDSRCPAYLLRPSYAMSGIDITVCYAFPTKCPVLTPVFAARTGIVTGSSLAFLLFSLIALHFSNRYTFRRVKVSAATTMSGAGGAYAVCVRS
eukprot:922647-Rhodomonas_salina.2